MLLVALTWLVGSGDPKWLDSHLAGHVYRPENSTIDLAVHDKKSGYYFVRSGECDGAIVSMVLTKDRKIVSDSGYRIPGYKFTSKYEDPDRHVVERSLERLGTGKGIMIGDTPKSVRDRLGFPTHANHSGWKKQFLNYEYEITFPHRGEYNDEVVISQTYTFKKGRLIEITFTNDHGE
jgi:hypothetical protein